MWRVNRALISNHMTIPPLMGLRKDHKSDINDNPVLGPKLRPLCPANVSPNAALGGLMASVARATGDEFQSRENTEVISTEELKFCISEANNRIKDRIQGWLQANHRPRRTDSLPPIQDMGSTVVLSMDVKALYLSVSKKLATRTMTKPVGNQNFHWLMLTPNN